MTANWLSLFWEANADDLLRTRPTPTALRVLHDLSEFKAQQVYTLTNFMASQGAAPSTPKLRSHLVIGDSHAKPDQSLLRYQWLGRMCAELRPDVIINIGDWNDTESLSSYDKGKRAFEGRRYVKDIEAANNAISLFHDQLPHNYAPRLVAIEGNHEHRVSRAVNDASEFDGLISFADVQFAEHGWEVVPFLRPIEIDGIVYSHYFQGGNSDKPISGENAARNLITKKMVSCVAGHSHLLNYARTVGATGTTYHGLTAGCYFTHEESYAAQSNTSWWRGICVLENVVNGDYDLQLYRMDTIKKRWG